MSEPKEITAALEGIERASKSPRELTKEAVACYRKGTVIDPDYDFSTASQELKQVVYGATVRFSRRRLWSRLLR